MNHFLELRQNFCFQMKICLRRLGVGLDFGMLVEIHLCELNRFLHLYGYSVLKMNSLAFV